MIPTLSARLYNDWVDEGWPLLCLACDMIYRFPSTSSHYSAVQCSALLVAMLIEKFTDGRV